MADKPPWHGPAHHRSTGRITQAGSAETTKVVEPKSASLSCAQSLRATSAGAAITGMAASTGEAAGATTPEAPSPFFDDWKERIIFPAAGAGVVGAAFGLLSRHRARLGAARAAVTYAANLAIVAGCYGGARELARDARATTPDDPMNSVVGGLASGAVLGRIQGGHFGAVKYAVTFAVAGTAMDYAALKLAPEWHAWKEQLSEKKDWLTLPEWSPIQVLDEEALAKKKAREEKLFAQRALGKLDKEDP